ncbi:MAG: aminopeptidase [Saprospiraceae bacterium]|nr:aminopeptidase [Saprospiraceae bacterium]
MKRISLLFGIFLAISSGLAAQSQENLAKQLKDSGYYQVKILPFTEVKNQGATGTCWDFSTLSFIESELYKKGMGYVDLSEMYLVHEIYYDKAKNYILRQGNARFSEGGLGHDVIRGIAQYGAMPEDQFTGYQNAERRHSHVGFEAEGKKFLDNLVEKKDFLDWGYLFGNIMHNYIPRPPKEFEIDGKKYTPQSYASEVLKYDGNDYIGFTSFTHHPFYKSFVVEVPDNYSNGAYYNLPLDEFTQVTKNALKAGYTVLWDADVSNAGFKQGQGLAMNIDRVDGVFNQSINERPIDQKHRQKLFENLTTQDDHLMHIVGTCSNKEGNVFFIVKNSWGANAGPFGGLIVVSESYFQTNTITIIMNKNGVSKDLLKNLKGPSILD